MWLVKDCPNFYTMPSLRYDQVFFNWEPLPNGSFWKCASYWSSKGLCVVKLVECEETEVEWWIYDGCSIEQHDSKKLGFLREAYDASKKIAANRAFMCKEEITTTPEPSPTLSAPL